MKGFSKFVVALTACATALLVFSCENDINEIGNDLFDGASSNVFYAKVISYNTNNDSIRSDEQMLQNAMLGVYEEPVFGRTKARFYSQARIGILNPEFGENAAMDSVILSIPVYYKTGEENIQIDTTYVYLQEGETPTDSATIRIKRTYKLDSIYGNSELPITLQVKEVAKYMQSQDSIHFSNPDLSNCQGCDNINKIEVLPQLLGAQQISNKVITYQTKKKNDPETELPPVTIKIKLDKDYFQQKFIDNEGSSDMVDQASFIRNFFRGIEISTPEEQGFLFHFQSASTQFNLAMYYHYDDPDAEEDEEETKNATLPLFFASYWSPTPGYNVQVNQFEHANRSSQFVNAYTNPNTVQGDSRLYLAGMDGTKTIIQIAQEELDEIRHNVQNNGWAIVGAELNIHVDDNYGLKKPPYLFAWFNYTEDGKVKHKSFTDVTEYYNRYPTAVQFNPPYNYKEDNKTYTIRITDYIKSIVERGEVYEDAKIVLSVGNFLMMPTSAYSEILNPQNPYWSDRAFNPNRVVLHGNNSEQADKQMKLKIYYTKK
jgi:hypothetical protein